MFVVTSEERRRYAYEASAMSGLGGVCCWRETWRDTGRCIWHADVGQKPTPKLEAAAPDIGERLDGAIFRDVRLSDEEWLQGRTLDGARMQYVVFTNVRADERTEFGEEVVYERELEAGDDEQFDRYEAARWTYRELQNLASDNGMASLSRRFYLRGRDLHRREAWEFGNYPSALFRRRGAGRPGTGPTRGA